MPKMIKSQLGKGWSEQGKTTCTDEGDKITATRQEGHQGLWHEQGRQFDIFCKGV